MSEKRFEYDRCTGIKDLSIDEDDDQFLYPTQIVEILNEQQARIEMLEKGILDCLFNNKSIGMLAEEMRLVE